MKKIAYVFLVIMFTCGCGVKRPPMRDVPVIEHDREIYIAVPKDVPAFDDSGPSPTGYILDDVRFHGTGLKAAQMMGEAFSPYASKIVTGNEYEPLETVLEKARELGAHYVFTSEFNIFMRRRIMWQPRKYQFLMVVGIHDLEKPGEPYTIGVRINQSDEPAYHTPEDMEDLRGPMKDLAKLVFEGKRPLPGSSSGQ